MQDESCLIEINASVAMKTKLAQQIIPTASCDFDICSPFELASSHSSSELSKSKLSTFSDVGSESQHILS